MFMYACICVRLFLFFFGFIFILILSMFCYFCCKPSLSLYQNYHCNNTCTHTFSYVICHVLSLYLSHLTKVKYFDFSFELLMSDNMSLFFVRKQFYTFKCIIKHTLNYFVKSDGYYLCMFNVLIQYIICCIQHIQLVLTHIDTNTK